MSSKRSITGPLHQAIVDAHEERQQMKREKHRKELLRQIEVYAWVTALLEVQTPNVNIRRQLESLGIDAVPYIKRKSIDVEVSREAAQRLQQETMNEIQVLIDLIGREVIK